MIQSLAPLQLATVAGHELLAERLRRHARERPAEPAFTFLRDGEEIESSHSWGELAEGVAAIAGALAERGLAGQRVLLVLPPGRLLVQGFLACLAARAVAVPFAPPATRRLAERLALVAADCAASAVLTDTSTRSTVEPLAAAQGLAVITVEACAGAGMALPTVEDADPAFLQYTSGSTGTPRGVIVSHGNLAADSALIRTAFAMERDDVVVNWLPLLHDMGLIGSVVQAVDIGQHSIHLTPQAMIRKPLRWLAALSRFRATVTGGPDFAWRLLAERLGPADLAGLDLSPLRVAYSGAEPVRASTLERVGRLLAVAGFDRRAWLPCYGMAEATLLVSGGPAGSDWRICPMPGGAAGNPAVGCGMPQAPVAVVDPHSCIRQPNGMVGEVWVQGPHVAAGYWGGRGDEAFAGRLAGEAGTWLRTGDLGFLAAGELFITGRIKDLVIINGRKHHPEDIEATIQELVPGCGGGACAVFQSADGDGQQLVAAVEMASRPADAEALAALCTSLGRAVFSRHELLVEVVVPVRTVLLPRTTSGKVRRGETRALYLAGGLG